MAKGEKSGPSLRKRAAGQAHAIRAELKEARKLPPDERKEARARIKEQRSEARREARSLKGAEGRSARKFRRMVERRVHLARTIISRIGIVLAALIAVAAIAIWLLAGTVLERAMLSGLPVHSPSAQPVQAASREAAKQVEEEGIVLLRNEGNILPLSSGTRLNLFGVGSVQSVFGGGGSGSADTSSATTLRSGLEHSGFEVNPTLYNLYANWANSGTISTEETTVDTSQKLGIEQTMGATYDPHELPASALTDEVLDDARSWSDVAVITISRTGSEGTDLPISYLKLTDDESAMVSTVCSRFDHVVVLLNTCNPMELGWIEDYPQIQGVLWIGAPGVAGADAVGEVMAGTVNPSGRTVDTYAYDLATNPANVMISDPRWANSEFKYSDMDKGYYIPYYEGIYVGYRYYETRYADDPAYDTMVQYPFGYGLSYTDFSWDVVDFKTDGENIQTTVRVTNVGSRAGKDVVELYYSAPWYPDRGIEKSAEELGAFGKTDELAPGQSQDVTLSLKMRDMASWSDTEGCYVLDEGTYAIRISRNSHDVVDTRNLEIPERHIYSADESTGTSYEDRFEDAAGDYTYLSRTDWESTWPDPDATDSSEAPSSAKEAMNVTIPNDRSAQFPVTGAENGITLDMLSGRDYDDPLWDQFLDQLTLDDMARQVSGGGYGTEGLERLGVPAKRDMDGPAAVNNVWARTSGVQFPAEIVLASTWNVDLASKKASCIADEALAYGVVGWYAPAANLHRSALGGRNFEYFSEDPLIAGSMSAAQVDAAQKKGLVCYLKHFALNEQENNRNAGGLFTWATEQTIRELYLRPFEICVKQGKPLGVMSSFARVGTTWCGASDELLDGVLRNEWGFKGVVVTDATEMIRWPYMNQAQGVLAGNDLYLDYGGHLDSMILWWQARDNAQLQQAMRTACHSILYSVANSAAMQ